MRLPTLATALVLATRPALAEAHLPEAVVAPVNGPGGVSGTVRAVTTASGRMLIEIGLADVPPGSHGVHIHETGDCSAADFSSAGGHLAGDGEAHGVLTEGGPHAGDLPNTVVGEDGVMTVAYFNDLLTMDMLTDADGSAFIVHAGEDDYESQPAGDAGSRVACGVFAPAD